MNEPRWPDMLEAADELDRESEETGNNQLKVLATWLRSYELQARHGHDPYPSVPLVFAREYLRERKG